MSTELDIVTKVLQTLTADLSHESAKAWSAIVPVYQINAMTHLIYGGVALVVMIGCIFGGLATFRSFKKRNGDNYLKADIDPATGLSWIILLFGAVIMFIIMFNDLVNLWNWVALWDPQAYAVHELLRHALSSR